MNVLILCTGNSCRSQMAEGWLKFFNRGNNLIESAGIEEHGLNPLAVKVMSESGVDISSQKSKTVDKVMNSRFDIVITVCDHAKENCPVFPGAERYIHQDFPDPAKAKGTETEMLESFRKTRDMIKDFCKKFVDTEW